MEIENANFNAINFFTNWLDEARDKLGLKEIPMALASSSLDGIPSVRIVYLKDISKQGFVFFTNYNSNKGKDLIENPIVELNFFWEELERQVRVTGSVEKISPNESDAYFKTRPRKSQLGAWASKQSQILESRKVFIDRLDKVDKKYPDEVPRPENWGGFRVVPEQIEFWQMGEFRLHDRFISEKIDDKWIINRLYP